MFEFEICLSNNDLQNLAPGAVNLQVTEQTNVGPRLGSSNFILTGTGVSYPAQPTLSAPLSPTQMYYSELISVGYLKTANAIVVLQGGFNTGVGQKGRAIAAYQYSDSMGTKMLTKDSRMFAFTVERLYGASTTNKPAPSMTTRGDQLVSTLLYGAPEKLRLINCATISDLTSVTCNDYGAPLAAELAEDASEMDVSADHNYAIIHVQQGANAPEIRQADLKANKGDLLPIAPGGKSMTLLDLDRDLDEELIVVNSNGTDVDVLKRTGSGSIFTSNSVMAKELHDSLKNLDIEKDPISFVRRADVNGDGIDDLLIIQTNKISALQIYARNCNQLMVKMLEAPAALRAVAVGDLNNDSKPDIIAGSGGPAMADNRIYIYLGQ